MTQNKKRLGLRIPHSLYKQIAAKSAHQGKTINSLCLEIFWKFFETEHQLVNHSPQNPTSI